MDGRGSVGVGAGDKRERFVYKGEERGGRVGWTGAGFYHSPGWGKNYPRLQILTVADLLAGKGIDMPPLGQVSSTFRRAPKAKASTTQTMTLPLGM